MHPHIQKNLHVFKKTFQKPSRIYRFLKESWKTNPLYLNRTLSYVSKHRDPRRTNKRETRIDVIASNLLKVKQENVNATHQKHFNASTNGCNNGNRSNENEERPQAQDKRSMIVCCFFNWICDDSTKTSQKTKSFGFTCPWCEVDYKYLDTLMMHLKCCHPRFNFNLSEEDGQYIIDMTLNSSFDGSYCGFKYPGHDLRRDFRFTPRFPERRNSTTQIIHFKSKERPNSSNQDDVYNDAEMFKFDDGEADVDVCSGRLYYHTSTCLPIKPNEVDIDSEADMDPEWLRERTQLMIDEFTDVNEGEKEILKLWNLHIMKNYRYKGDNMIRQACLDFVDSEGYTILSKNLTRNFTLHLANLHDFGLLGSEDLLECVRRLYSARQK